MAALSMPSSLTLSREEHLDLLHSASLTDGADMAAKAATLIFEEAEKTHRQVLAGILARRGLTLEMGATVDLNSGEISIHSAKTGLELAR